LNKITAYIAGKHKTTTVCPATEISLTKGMECLMFYNT